MKSYPALPDRNAGTLLIVDDEAGVLHAIRETLEDSNYRMIMTTDPSHALRVLESDDTIDVAIFDLYMPSMDGSKLLTEGRRLRPDLSVVLTSGIASSDQLRRWRARGELIVAKPWRDGELETAIGKALGRRNGQHGAKRARNDGA
jgi:two-component system, cell cycle sensor histidine kinase and response regulator CckA